MNYTNNIFFKLINNVQLHRKNVSYGKNLTLNGILHIHGTKGKIKIGDNVTITSSDDINPTSGFSSSHLRIINQGIIEIGDNVGISNSCITSQCGITIEQWVQIGSGVKIIDTDFHSIFVENRQSKENDIPEFKPITIKKGAFIGMCSLILKGVTIGEGAVIGAGSVVTCDIPPYEIWAGNPAKKIKSI